MIVILRLCSLFAFTLIYCFLFYYFQIIITHLCVISFFMSDATTSLLPDEVVSEKNSGRNSRRQRSVFHYVERALVELNALQSSKPLKYRHV